MRNHAKYAAATATIIGVWCLATGWMDLDWMIVCYKYQFGQGLAANTTWEFCPYIITNWWVAWQLSLARIILGSALIGGALTYILFIGEKQHAPNS
jgi:hypothetical protein